MTEPAKLEVVKEKPKKVIKPKIEQVIPTDIIEVWRLAEHAIRDSGQTYPDFSEDSSDVMRSHILAYLQAPTFFGLMAKIGKRPAGVLLGHVANRPFGRPYRYFDLWCFWVDPQFRSNLIGHSLWERFSAELKRNNLYHWEGKCSGKLLETLQKSEGVQVSQLQQVIGGKI
jgi:ribosomal protein S18 acetylase RimI-like enzyme